MIVTMFLGLLCGFLLFQVFLAIQVVVRRWKLGMFKHAVSSAIWVAVFLVLFIITASGLYTNLTLNQQYEKVGAEDVDFIGERKGFENPLVAYTDAETGELCIGERVGGEEFLKEVTCITPSE